MGTPALAVYVDSALRQETAGRAGLVATRVTRQWGPASVLHTGRVGGQRGDGILVTDRVALPLPANWEAQCPSPSTWTMPLLRPCAPTCWRQCCRISEVDSGIPPASTDSGVRRARPSTERGTRWQACLAVAPRKSCSRPAAAR